MMYMYNIILSNDILDIVVTALCISAVVYYNLMRMSTIMIELKNHLLFRSRRILEQSPHLYITYMYMYTYIYIVNMYKHTYTSIYMYMYYT